MARQGFQGVAQNRSGIQTAGVDVLKYDMLAFGSARLSPEQRRPAGARFPVHPACGAVPTVRGFEIIVVAGLGSIPGILVAGLLLGIAKAWARHSSARRL